jgi:hypothetical protein
LGQGAFYASEQDVAETYLPLCGDAAWYPQAEPAWPVSSTMLPQP